MQGPGSFPEILQVVIYSLEEKLVRTSLEKQFDLPPLSGSDGRIILFIFIFACSRFLTRAVRRLICVFCCLHVHTNPDKM